MTAASGAIGSKGSPGEAIVTIVDDEALKVTGVAVTSTPSSGSTYGAGETISFTATFSAKVTVTGTPQLPFSLGGVTRQAALASGSGRTLTLTLAAAVTAADTVTVSYAVPGSNPLQDAGGTDAPAFANATAARSFTETVGDAVAAAGNVGAVVTATDADADPLTYTLEGADAAKFGIVSGSGQIQTRAGEKYDREAKVSYSVTVKADDGMGGSDTVAVTISVADAVEIPLAPVAPTVAATSGSTTSLDVSWTAPGNTGRPALSGYKLQYRQGSSGGWTDHAHSGAGTTATIASLTAATAYEVQVRAVNARRRRGVVGLGRRHDRFLLQQRAGIFRHHGGAQFHRDGGRCGGGREQRGRRGDGDGRRRRHAHLHAGRRGRGEVHGEFK